jgi:hypothetical protein
MKKILLVLILTVGTLVSKAQINPDLRNKVLELIKGKERHIIGYDLDKYTITNLDIKPITEGQFILDDIEFLKNSEDSNTFEIKKKIEQLELNYKYMPSYKKDILKYYKVTLDILGELRPIFKRTNYKHIEPLNRRFRGEFDPINDYDLTLYKLTNTKN